MADPITIGTAAGAAGAWAWEAFGKDIVSTIFGTAKEKLRGQWKKFNWDKAAKAYRENLRRQPAQAGSTKKDSRDRHGSPGGGEEQPYDTSRKFTVVQELL